jgi:glutamyl-tRNA reductase
LVLVGCNHRTAPVAVRERLAFDGPKLGTALDALAQRFPRCETVVLSTCNRVELYCAGSRETTPEPAELTAWLSDFHEMPAGEFAPHLYDETDLAAVRHLFTVAGSVDSLVPGEAQILGQVKAAYQSAQAHGRTGPVTHALFQRAIAVGKQVHTETGIAQKKVSVSSVAVEFACEIFQAEHFPEKTVLVIGAGEMGELTLEHLRELQPGRILVTNRSPQKAAEVAARWSGEPVPFDRLDDWLVQADLVVSTTGAPDPLIDRPRFERIMRRRGNRLVFIIDIAVPRDFTSDVGDLDNVYLYNIDDLERQRQKNLEQRNRELHKARAIIDRQADAFLRDLAHQRHSGPVIADLRRTWAAKREDELARLFAQLPHLSDDDRTRIARSFERFENQLLHPPLSALKNAAANGPPHGLIEALKRLFHI